MSIPNWYELALLGLAAWRTWLLLAEDTILDWPRNRSYELAFRIGGPKTKHYWQEMVECPLCLGAWLAFAWVGAWQLWPHGTLVAAAFFAVSAVVGIVGQLVFD